MSSRLLQALNQTEFFAGEPIQIEIVDSVVLLTTFADWHCQELLSCQ